MFESIKKRIEDFSFPNELKVNYRILIFFLLMYISCSHYIKCIHTQICT